jgi:hypothetical protein
MHLGLQEGHDEDGGETGSVNSVDQIVSSATFIFRFVFVLAGSHPRRVLPTTWSIDPGHNCDYFQHAKAAAFRLLMDLVNHTSGSSLRVERHHLTYQRKKTGKKVRSACMLQRDSYISTVCSEHTACRAPLEAAFLGPKRMYASTIAARLRNSGKDMVTLKKALKPKFRKLAAHSRIALSKMS